MRRNPGPRGAWAFLLFVAVVAATGAAPATAPPPATGQLQVRVAVVGADLAVKPVPKQRFLVVPEAGETHPVVTSFDGTLSLTLPAGRYHLRSEAAIEISGKRYSWDEPFQILGGESTAIELSNDNARIETTLAPTASAPEGGLDSKALYERFKGGVFKIIADGGHGSGFLVSEAGLILTNHHVAGDATYLAARVDDQHKYQAALLAEDARHDLAVLRVHPDAVRGRPVLPLADDSADGGPSVGDRVVAIGSPLTAETILTEGVVSKLQDESILSDVNINPGNSGGPLLDRRGRVVGVSTFTISDEAGPGLSGIVRAGLARALIEASQGKIAGSEPPSSRALPIEAAYRFDPDDVKTMAETRQPKIEDYRMPAGKMDVLVLTPVLVASEILRAEREAIEGRNKRQKSKDAPETAKPTNERFYAWQKDQDNFVPVVRIRARPEIKLSAGSVFKLGFTGRGGQLRFKTDFDRMELRRGDQVVEPILPGRIREVVNVAGPAASMKDIAYWGQYDYPPEAFLPGSPLTLRLWERGQTEPQVIPVAETLRSSIEADFKPYLDSKGRPNPATK